MKWDILGAGSIGCLWAAHLTLGGYPARLLLKDLASAELFAANPLRLETPAGLDQVIVDTVAVHDLASEIECLLVTTKSHSTREALAAVEAWLSPNCRIMLLQNGIGIQQQVAESYPRHAVIAGVTTDGAYRREPYHVVHAGRGSTSFGAIANVSSAAAEVLQETVANIGLEAGWVEDIWPPIWQKVAINCCINAPSALRQCRNGELLDNADSLQQIRGLAAEVQQVMAAARLGFSFPNLLQQVIDVIEATAANYSSMCLDVKQGRRTEIEWINGFICAEGDRLGVPTPLNRVLLDEIVRLGKG